VAYERVKPTYLPNDTGTETFLHQPEAVRGVDWIFIIGVPAWRGLGEYVTLDRMFYNFVFKWEVVTAPISFTFSSLSHSSRSPLLEIKNYIVHSL